MMSGNEISQFLFLFLMPYMVKVKRRPLWTAAGLSVSALGCLLLVIPHFTSDYSLLEKEVETTSNTTSTTGLCGINDNPSSSRCDGEGKKEVSLSLIFFNSSKHHLKLVTGRIVFWKIDPGLFNHEYLSSDFSSL